MPKFPLDFSDGNGDRKVPSANLGGGKLFLFFQSWASNIEIAPKSAYNPKTKHMS